MPYRQEVEGDRCPRCERGTSAPTRIEVGRYLPGTKVLRVHEGPTSSGHDGVGGRSDGDAPESASRERWRRDRQHTKPRGIVWPAQLAPVGAHVIPVNVGDATLQRDRRKIAQSSKGRESHAPRRSRRAAGVKFKTRTDRNPARVTVGPRASAKERCVELKPRSRGRGAGGAVGEVVSAFGRLVRSAMTRTPDRRDSRFDLTNDFAGNGCDETGQERGEDNEHGAVSAGYSDMSRDRIAV